MSETQRKLHRYFDRLCDYCVISAIFTFAAAFSMTEYARFMLLFIAPHSLFFILAEIKMQRRLYVAAQMLCVLSFSGIIFLVSPHRGALVILLSFLYFIFSMEMFGRSREETDAAGVGLFAIAANILAIAIFSFMVGGADAGTARSYEHMYNIALPVFLINIGLALISRLLCKFFIGLDWLTRPFVWRRTEAGNTEKSAERAAKRGQKYAVLYVCAIVLVAFSLTARHYSDEAIHNMFAARERVFERDEIFAVEPAPDETPEQLMEMSDETDAEMPVPPEEEAETAYPSEPNYLLGTVLALLLIMLLILISGIRRAKKARGEDSDDEGLVETAYTEKRTRTARRMLFSANNTIRAMFRRKANYHRKRGLFIKTSDTARIISDGINKTEDITVLSELYHAARYSGKQLTGGDVAKARKKKKN